MIEQLESRQLLAAWLHDGTLVVQGDAEANDISVRSQKGHVLVTVDGVGLKFRSNKVQHVYVFGGRGDDEIHLGGSLVIPHVVDGAAGNDFVSGSDASDQFEGGPGKDNLNGNGGDDTLLGGSQRDTLQGGDGTDHLDGEAGVNLLIGDHGNDRYLQAQKKQVQDGHGRNHFVAGRLREQLKLAPTGPRTKPSSGVKEGVPVVKPVPPVTPPGDVGSEADLLFRTTFGNYKVFAKDSIHMGYGGGVLYVASASLTGHLRLTLASPNGKLYVAGPTESITLDAGIISRIIVNAPSGGSSVQASTLAIPMNFRGSSGVDVVNAGRGDDSLTGDAGNDHLRGGDGNDTITGGAGGDTLRGDDGDDKLYSLDGEQDTLTGGDGDDWADNAGDPGIEIETRVSVLIPGSEPIPGAITVGGSRLIIGGSLSAGSSPGGALQLGGGTLAAGGAVSFNVNGDLSPAKLSIRATDGAVLSAGTIRVRPPLPETGLLEVSGITADSGFGSTILVLGSTTDFGVRRSVDESLRTRIGLVEQPSSRAETDPATFGVNPISDSTDDAWRQTTDYVYTGPVDEPQTEPTPGE